MLDFKTYNKIIKELVEKYDVSPKELYIISDVLEMFEDYCDSDDYNEDKIIENVLKSNFYMAFYDDMTTYSIYQEVRNNLNIKEIDEN